MRQGALGFAVLATLCAAAPAAPQDSPSTPPPTFAGEVAALIHRRCLGCHQAGEATPFVLATYRDVRKRGRQILDVVEQRLMPPWRPEPGYGEFRDVRRLPDAEIDLLRRWVAGGMPEGDPRHTPIAPAAVEGWPLGTPDLIVRMPKPYRLKAEGRDVFRNFVVPLGLTEERWLAAAHLRPGNLRVTHHAFVTIDARRRGRKLAAQAPGLGFGGLGFGSGDGIAQVWAPGTTPHRFPDDSGLRVPAGSDVVLQFHLQPNGAPEELQATVGLYFHARPPARALTTIPLAIHDLRIPAGKAAYEVARSFTMRTDTQVLAIFPHMHALGQEVQVFARTPSRVDHPMVWIKRWSFAWQDLYQYAEPLHLPKGTVVRTRFVFDNSADNPEQPHDPPRVVRWGSQGTDEMALVMLQVLQPRDRNPKRGNGLGGLGGQGR